MQVTSSAPWRALRGLWSSLRRSRTFRRLVDHDPTRRHVLIVNHFFDPEIAVLMREKGFSQRFVADVVGPQDLWNRAVWHFPPDLWHGRIPYDDPRMERARRRSRAEAKRTLARLQRRGPLHAIITPSDIFYWLRETINEAQAQNIPTIVIDKEGTVTPAQMANHAVTINALFPPIASLYYVWSRRQRDFWIKAGVPADRIRVLGSLRTDLFVGTRRSPRPAVLFYDFHVDTYVKVVPAQERQGLPRDWSAFREELLDVLFASARKHPDVTFSIKCHPQQPGIAEVQARVRSLGCPNVQVLTGAMRGDRLLSQHSLVVGFQSTALLEAAFTDLDVLYCGWGPLHDAMIEKMIPLHDPRFGAHHCKSREELEAAIEGHLSGRPLKRKDPGETGHEYFYRPDGNVAQRVVAALDADVPF